MSTAESTDILESTSAHPTYEEYKDSGVDWLGEIPAHWETIRLNWAADYINGYMFSPDDRGNEGLPIIRIAQLTGEDENFARYDGDLDEKYKITEGDLLFSWSATLDAFVWSQGPAWLNQHIFKVRPISKVDRRYLGYCLKSIIPVLVRDSHGSTMQHIKRQALKDHSISLPPPDEQRAIAAYLDRETERIDALIEKKEQLIDLLEEKRTALISRVVTKGLDADVEMQDSGVEWLGEIPAGWEAVRCGAIFREVDDRNHPDLPLLNVSIHSGVTRRTFSDEYIEQQAEDWSSYKRALEGDIVYNKMRFWQGAVGTAPIDGLVSPDYVVARTRADDLPKYYEYLFDTPLFETEVKRFSYGMVEDRFRLYWDRFKQMKTLRPPAERQRRIVVYLDRETNRVGELVEKVEYAIECLKEYRTALISAAVTGQIDVRDEVASSEVKEINTWARMNLVMELIRRMRVARHQSFGRTMLVKMLYLIQHHLQVSGFQFQYKRKDYGPYAPELRYEVENSLRDQGWISVFEGSEQVEYELQEQADDETVEGYFQESWGDIEEQIDEIVSYFHHFDAEQAEIVATLYAAWNDLLILDQPHSEDDIIHEVRHNWHPRKQTIDEDRWRRALRWMKEEGLVPSGFGEPTVDDE